jgi:4-hydroxy-2-oxoheptanedioate aldolase
VSATTSSASITERVRGGETAVGTFLNLGSPLAGEICARAGFDWLLVDLEHGAGTESELVATLHAVAPVPALVRVESSERPRVQRVIDAGADGVMLPRLEGADEVRAAVAHLRYAPRGDRGVAYMNRGAGWRARAPERELLCVVQIETPGAVAEAAEIAAVDGVDVLFVGPNDLRAALETDDLPLDEIVSAATRAGKAAGIFTGTRADADAALERGFRFVSVGSDSFFLAEAARAAAGARGASGSEPQATR